MLCSATINWEQSCEDAALIHAEGKNLVSELPSPLSLASLALL